MGDYLEFYQHLPSFFNPIFFQIGSFSVRWYGIMYLVAFIVFYFILNWRVKRGEAGYSQDLILDFLTWAVAGLLAGGRLGYVLFYNLPYYLDNLLEIFLPIKFSGTGMLITGFYGMSFYGGVAGVVAVIFLWTRKNKLDFWQWADFIVPAVPLAYFFGRMGNFLNGELFGRVTNSQLGMFFSNDSPNKMILRHPSQLYEAFFEGLVVFVILWLMRKRKVQKGTLALIYLGLYGFFRFWIEFLREPDPQIGLFFSFFTLGQFFSAIIVLASGTIYFYQKNRHEKKY